MRLENDDPYKWVKLVDVTDLKQSILHIPASHWKGSFSRSTDQHMLNADVDSIVIRHGIKQGSPMYRNTEAYDLIREPLEAVLKQLPGADRVRLANLRAGGKIPQHVDAAPYFNLQHRLHVPIITNKHVFFDVNNSIKRMMEGEVWEINNIVPHGVYNFGNSDRIHMVVDYYDV
jgi:aspartyl/asparaginyl beta-hydroxylase (cupin superfamily)